MAVGSRAASTVQGCWPPLPEAFTPSQPALCPISQALTTAASAQGQALQGVVSSETGHQPCSSCRQARVGAPQEARHLLLCWSFRAR